MADFFVLNGLHGAAPETFRASLTRTFSANAALNESVSCMASLRLYSHATPSSTFSLRSYYSVELTTSVRLDGEK